MLNMLLGSCAIFEVDILETYQLLNCWSDPYIDHQQFSLYTNIIKCGAGRITIRAGCLQCKTTCDIDLKCVNLRLFYFLRCNGLDIMRVIV